MTTSSWTTSVRPHDGVFRAVAAVMALYPPLFFWASFPDTSRSTYQVYVYRVCPRVCNELSSLLHHVGAEVHGEQSGGTRIANVRATLFPTS